jgi:hypothetical protein
MYLVSQCEAFFRGLAKVHDSNPMYAEEGVRVTVHLKITLSVLCLIQTIDQETRILMQENEAMMRESSLISALLQEKDSIEILISLLSILTSNEKRDDLETSCEIIRHLLCLVHDTMLLSSMSDAGCDEEDETVLEEHVKHALRQSILTLFRSSDRYARLINPTEDSVDCDETDESSSLLAFPILSYRILFMLCPDSKHVEGEASMQEVTAIEMQIIQSAFYATMTSLTHYRHHSDADADHIRVLLVETKRCLYEHCLHLLEHAVSQSATDTDTVCNSFLSSNGLSLAMDMLSSLNESLHVRWKQEPTLMQTWSKKAKASSSNSSHVSTHDGVKEESVNAEETGSANTVHDNEEESESDTVIMDVEDQMMLMAISEHERERDSELQILHRLLSALHTLLSAAVCVSSTMSLSVALSNSARLFDEDDDDEPASALVPQLVIPSETSKYLDRQTLTALAKRLSRLSANIGLFRIPRALNDELLGESECDSDSEDERERKKQPSAEIREPNQEQALVDTDVTMTVEGVETETEIATDSAVAVTTSDTQYDEFWDETSQQYLQRDRATQLDYYWDANTQQWLLWTVTQSSISSSSAAAVVDFGDGAFTNTHTKQEVDEIIPAAKTGYYDEKGFWQWYKPGEAEAEIERERVQSQTITEQYAEEYTHMDTDTYGSFGGEFSSSTQYDESSVYYAENDAHQAWTGDTGLAVPVDSSVAMSTCDADVTAMTIQNEQGDSTGEQQQTTTEFIMAMTDATDASKSEDDPMALVSVGHKNNKKESNKDKPKKRGGLLSTKEQREWLRLISDMQYFITEL